MMYLYPRNLKAKPLIWLWRIQDVCVLAFSVILSLVALLNLGWLIPLTGSIAFGVLTMRIEDTSISDYILHACIFFLSQQEFLWERDYKENGENNGNKRI